MATSADKDDRDKDEKDTAKGDEETSGKKTATPSEAGEPKATAAAGDKDDEGEDDEGEDDEGEDDEDAAEDEAEDAKLTPNPKASLAKSAAPVKGAGTAKPGAGVAPLATAKRVPAPAGVKQVRGKPVPVRQAGSLGKTLILFVLIVGGLAAAFAFLGREDNAAPKWKVGQTVDLDITLVPSDGMNLACAAIDEVTGRHCAFEAANKPWSKGDTKDDKTLLRPYTTTSGTQFFTAGLWSDPALSASALPKDDARFTAHCKYKVEGSINKAQVRWKTGEPWYDWNEPHYVGIISDCKLTP